MKKLITSGSILLAFAAWALLNWPALLSLHLRWIKLDEAYAIGYPVVAIFLWLIFERRTALLSSRIKPSIIAVIFFLSIAAVSLSARLVQFQLLQQLIVPASLWLLIVAVAGWRVGRIVLFPSLLLYAAIPLWDALVGPLRGFTVYVTQHALDFAGVPALIEGYLITLPDGQLMVADGCSGLNLLLAAAVIGLVQFHMMIQSPLWKRCVALALALAIGVIDNWIRVSIIVLVGHFSHMESDLVHHHGNFGWVVFVISLVPYFIAVSSLERGQRLVRTPVGAPAPAVAPFAAAAHAVSLAIGVLLLLTAVTFLQQRAGKPLTLPAPPSSVEFAPEWTPHYTGFDEQQAWRMSADGNNYEILMLTYTRQTDNKKLIYFSNRIAEEGQIITPTTTAVIDQMRINKTVIVAGSRRVVWWFYLIDNQVVTSGIAAKWHQLIGLLRGNQRASLVAVSARCVASDCGDILRDGAMPIGVRQLLTNWVGQIAAKND